MVTTTRTHAARAQAGVTLVEVLVTLVILAIGLLGLVALQARVQVLQAEAYQRAQALMLLKDMAGRIANNGINAGAYVTTAAAPLGIGMTCPTAGITRQSRDLAEWCTALQGAAESLAGTSVGAMVGGRGCIEEDAFNPGRFLITVAWQGLAPISAPPESVACAANAYDGGAGSSCTDDLCRRVVTTVVRIPTLTT
jgi:type IV pilus assembly protein PilV